MKSASFAAFLRGCAVFDIVLCRFLFVHKNRRGKQSGETDIVQNLQGERSMKLLRREFFGNSSLDRFSSRATDHDQLKTSHSSVEGR